MRASNKGSDCESRKKSADRIVSVPASWRELKLKKPCLSQAFLQNNLFTLSSIAFLNCCSLKGSSESFLCTELHGYYHRLLRRTLVRCHRHSADLPLNPPPKEGEAAHSPRLCKQYYYCHHSFIS